VRASDIKPYAVQKNISLEAKVGFAATPRVQWHASIVRRPKNPKYRSSRSSAATHIRSAHRRSAANRSAGITSQPGRPERVAWNARLRTDGGCIFADVSNADTSAVVIRHQTNTHRSTTRRRVIRSSRASSRANDGFTIIARERVSPAPSFKARTRIRRISLSPGRPERCPQIGKRCCMNKWQPLARG
jgi:hypothetical protein